VFEVAAGDADADAKASPPGIIFHPASGIDEAGLVQVQADLRRRILRAFVGRGLIESCDAKEMLAYQHSGFSVNAGVCIEAHDRAALERLLRYCARPPFAMDRLRKAGTALAPNSPLRAAVTALAAPALQATVQTVQASAERGHAWGGASGQCWPTPDRARGAQALTGTRTTAVG